ncbi:MAG: hypothetical protein M0Z87_02315 [Actinomycetota bacterium]|nr:hypothetical protein [Actinomycetota bacterium]
MLLHGSAFGLGALLVLGTAVSVLRALVVPRPPARGPLRLALSLMRKGFGYAVRVLPSYDAQDRLLVLEEPVALLTVLMTWLALVWMGYALCLWAVEPTSLSRALEESAASMVTLGSVAGRDPTATMIDFFAAVTGLVVVALQIGYLPTLYGAYNRRERLVTMLESRAGVPAWGPELLVRHQLVGIVDDLPTFYSAWEAWAADVAESHSTYPSLLHFRSPQSRFSWIVALLAVLDSAALYLAVSPAAAPSQARLCLRMGFSALRDIARAVGVPYDPDPDPSEPIDLTRAEFQLAVQRLEEAGFPMERPAEEAWPHFHGWRVNYEELAYRFAAMVHAPAAPWSGPRPGLRRISVRPQRPVDRRPGEA